MSAEFSKLYRAIMSDDQTVYTELRNTDVLQETVKHSKDTLLHVAAYWKRRRIAEIIINRQSCLLRGINAKDETPLHAAASAGSVDVTQLIIDRCRLEAPETGESILRKKSKNEEDTALHKAIRNGHLEVVRLLIREDPELTKSVNKDGDSPLFMAVDTRQLDIADDIILTVLDCSFKGRKNMNALHAAIAHRDSLHDTARGIVTSLIQNREAGLVEQQDDEFGWTPLHHAANMNDTQTIQQLVSAKHSVASIKDNNGMTALHIAAKRGHIKAVEKLVEICPEICGIVDDEGQSFFHVAVEKGRDKVARFALGKRYHFLIDYLLYAIFQGMPEPLVINFGGSHQQLFPDEFLNMQDNQGNTALHLAATKKDDFIFFLMTSDRRWSKATSNSDGLNAFGRFRINPFTSLQSIFIATLFSGGKRPMMHGAKRRMMQLFRRPENKRPEEEVDKNRELREMNLLISTIIATVSFTAALSVPGGFKNNGPDEGTAALAQKRDFRRFFIFNAIAFGLSVTSMFLTRYNPKFKSPFDDLTELLSHGATTAMLIAFFYGTSAVLGPSEAELARLVKYALLGCLLLLYLLSLLLVKIKSATESTDENEE